MHAEDHALAQELPGVPFQRVHVRQPLADELPRLLDPAVRWIVHVFGVFPLSLPALVIMSFPTPFAAKAPLVHDGEVRQVLVCTLETAHKRKVESLGTAEEGTSISMKHMLRVP